MDKQLKIGYIIKLLSYDLIEIDFNDEKTNTLFYSYRENGKIYSHSSFLAKILLSDEILLTINRKKIKKLIKNWFNLQNMWIKYHVVRKEENKKVRNLNIYTEFYLVELFHVETEESLEKMLLSENGI